MPSRFGTLEIAIIALILILLFGMEVRKRLFFVASIFLISSALGFIYYEKIITTSLGIFNLEGINIVFTSPFQFLELSVNS